MSPLPSRREFLKNSYLGLGSLALMDLLAGDAGALADSAENPLLPRPAHLPARAKRCIFLFMEGGVSQMDTFEYRPVLDKYAGQQMPSVRGTDLDVASLGSAHNRIIPSPPSASPDTASRAAGCRNCYPTCRPVSTTWPSSMASPSTAAITRRLSIIP